MILASKYQRIYVSVIIQQNDRQDLQKKRQEAVPHMQKAENQQALLRPKLKCQPTYTVISNQLINLITPFLFWLWKLICCGVVSGAILLLPALALVPQSPLRSCPFAMSSSLPCQHLLHSLPRRGDRLRLCGTWRSALQATTRQAD